MFDTCIEISLTFLKVSLTKDLISIIGMSLRLTECVYLVGTLVLSILLLVVVVVVVYIYIYKQASSVFTYYTITYHNII